MRKSSSVLSLGLLTVLFTSCLTGCSKEDVLTIRVLTSEDYIYIDEETGETLNDYFETWYEEEYGTKIKVAYETTDTNETMYNLLKTGKTHYDLMCTSDYIIQKLAAEDEIQVIDLNDVPDYRDYCSRYIDNNLRSAFQDVLDAQNAPETSTYSVGYMWGTLGLIFNPEYEDFSEDVSYDDVIHAASDWGMLWDENFKHTASIKDSMRDTFAVATMQAFSKEFGELKDAYNFGEGTMTTEEYRENFDRYFNFMAEENIDKDAIKRVKDALVSLKKNSFGLEVDSGKQDIVTGKVGINLAWSGDATNSMWEAEESGEVDLVYSVPENGSNVWFDGWVVPKYDEREQEVYDAAMAYLNYLSTPENAYLNMTYVGYTSFVAGDSIVDYVRDNFDVRCNNVFYVDEDENWLDLYYEDDQGEEQSFYYDCLAEELSYNPDLYYYNDDDEQVKIGEKYNDRLFDYDSVEPDVDLRFYFLDTLDEYTEDDCLFYSDENYYLEDGITGETSKSVGGIFFCAYPEEDILDRCCIMRDYGENNKQALKLWEEFKSDSLPTAAWVIMIIELALMLGGIIYYFVGNCIKLSLRKKRKENKN